MSPTAWVNLQVSLSGPSRSRSTAKGEANTSLPRAPAVPFPFGAISKMVCSNAIQTKLNMMVPARYFDAIELSASAWAKAGLQ